MDKEIDVQAYLERIGFDEKVTVSLPCLQKLHKLNLLQIPFENLDMHIGRKITLNPAQFFDKIVHQKRGGFCFELNGLFYELLTHYKYSAKLISCRILDKKNDNFDDEFGHLALMVTLGNKNFLCDVGFGELAFEPLEIQLNKIQEDSRGLFKFERFNKEYLSLSVENKDAFQCKYIFSPVARKLRDFEGMCLYHQTSPLSHFTQNKLISIPTEKGRISLTEKSLKIWSGNETKESAIRNNSEFNTALKKYFQIVL